MSTVLNVELPRSKSLSNRWLLLAKLSGGNIALSGLSDSTDTLHLQRLLDHHGPVYDAGDGGTTFRFLLAYLCLLPGHHQLAGSGRITSRPVHELVDALRGLGAKIDYTGLNDHPPLMVEGGFIKGGRIEVDVSRSSQFASALLLIGPFLREGLVLSFRNKPVSKTYIEMTLQLLAAAGVKFELQAQAIIIRPQGLDVRTIEIERDWSSAAFFYELAALRTGTRIHLPGLRLSGLQGDEVAARLFARLGVNTYSNSDGLTIVSESSFQNESEVLEFDLRDTPDLALPLVMTCLGRKIKSRFTGIGHLRHKESDRVMALERLVFKAGGKSHADTDSISLDEFPSVFQPLDVDPLRDHRIAMSSAVFSATGTPVFISDSLVVKKSFPDFWNAINPFGLAVTH